MRLWQPLVPWGGGLRQQPVALGTEVARRGLAPQLHHPLPYNSPCLPQLPEGQEQGGILAPTPVLLDKMLVLCMVVNSHSLYSWVKLSPGRASSWERPALLGC